MDEKKENSEDAVISQSSLPLGVNISSTPAEKVLIEEDFIMLPYYGPAPLSFAPGVITAWGLGVLIMSLGFISAFLANDAKCLSDKCKLFSIGFLAGGIFTMFIGGLFIVGGLAMMTAPRRRISKEKRDKNSIIALSGELQAEIAKHEMTKHMNEIKKSSTSPQNFVQEKEEWPQSLPVNRQDLTE